MHPCLRLCTRTAFLMLLAQGAAQAGRPMATEDADFLAPKACEWESVGARARASGEPSTTTLQTQISCGVGFNSQIALGVARARSDGESVPGVALGGKTAFIPRVDDGLGLTLAWGLVAAKAPGESMRHDTSFLNLVASKVLTEGFTGHANVGWLHSRVADASATTWNLGLEWAAQPGLDLTAEAFGDSRSDPWMGLGVRYAASEVWSLNAAYQRQSSQPKLGVWSIGAKFSF